MKFAVIVHIYYVSLWDGLASAIKNITDDFELFITLSESIEDKEGLVAKILADFPTAKIEVVENKGYDILPFLKVLKTLDLDKYSGVVKLHTKRDMPTDDFRLQPEWRGGSWREALLGFISTKEAWQASLAKFSSPEVSVVSDMRVFWCTKEECSKSFRIDLDVENFCREYFGFKINGTKVSFVAGTMFLAKPAALKALKSLPLDSLDFGGGNSHKHSIAHVLERVLGVLAEKEGEIAAWQNNQTTRSFVRRRELRRVLQNILRFFFQKKTTRSGYKIVKVLKIPVWRSKAKKTYDICFGLGEACMCSKALREANLQFASYPFDWVFSRNPLKCVELLASEFKDFFNREDFKYIQGVPETGMGRYLNTRTNFVHPHDFTDKSVIDDEMYRFASDKYTRRISRLYDQLAHSKRVLMVCLCMPNTPERTAEELRKVRATVLAKYPQLELDLLVFQCDSTIPFEKKRLSLLSEGVYETRFDYSHQEPPIDIPKIVSALKEFKIVAVDHRTQSEKDAYEARKKSEVQGKPVKRGAISKIRYEFNRFVVLPPKKLAAMFRRKRYQHVLSLGMNCEIAFRQVIAWGAVDSSLFNWGTTESLSNLTHALEHFEDLFNGEIERGSNGLWKCAHTGISTHGRKYTAEDKEDTLARMKYLKEKFLKQISDEGKTLLVRRLHDGDLESPNFKEDLLKFDSALRKLGARNHEYLLVVEERNIEKVPRIEGFHVRTVKAFNPTNEVTKKRIGDYVGWSTIFSEFVPVAKPKRRGPYKFEVT